ncbi:MAG: tetratricopeptide repeat protein, partial [Gammaproteobacteria bacterium]|nr:tetratricopeptide repeat protein [Gammaproteobacteria bacterium]
MSPPSAPGKQRGRGIARARESKGLERKFSRALADHQSGRVADAEKRYREILRRQADHVGALYYLALLLEQTGRGEAAVEYMARAVEFRPGDAVLQNNFGNLLKSAGRPGDAVRAYREAIRLDPAYANACFNLGVALQEAGDPAGAREAFEELTRRAPGDGDGWTALGTALVEQGEP